MLQVIRTFVTGASWGFDVVTGYAYLDILVGFATIGGTLLDSNAFDMLTAWYILFCLIILLVHIYILQW